MPELDSKDISERIESIATRLDQLHAKNDRDWISYIPIFTAALTLVIAVFTALLNYNLKNLEQKQKEVEAKIGREQEGAAFSLALLHEILGVLGENTGDQKKITAMSTLLYSLEETYRRDIEKEQLRVFVIKLEELLPATNPIAGFAQDTAMIPVRNEPPTTSGPAIPPPAAPLPSSPRTSSIITPQPSGTLVSEGDPKGWDYDIFSCEEEPGSMPLAKMLFDALRKRDERSLGLLGRIRLRSLPQEINQRQDYRVYKSIVIKSSPDKFEQAAKLREWAKRVLPDQTVTVERSDRKLPWYLSLFVCKAA